MGIFGRAAPARVETDKVIPLGFLDNSPVMTRIVLYNLMVYDDVLDPEKLRDALDRLVQRPGWGKMGARLRSNVGFSSSCRAGRIKLCATIGDSI